MRDESLCLEMAATFFMCAARRAPARGFLGCVLHPEDIEASCAGAKTDLTTRWLEKS